MFGAKNINDLFNSNASEVRTRRCPYTEQSERFSAGIASHTRATVAASWASVTGKLPPRPVPFSRTDPSQQRGSPCPDHGIGRTGPGLACAGEHQGELAATELWASQECRSPAGQRSQGSHNGRSWLAALAGRDQGSQRLPG